MTHSTDNNPTLTVETMKPEVASDIVTKTSDAMKKLDENPNLAKEIRKYGKVPVLYGPTRSMIKPPNIPGLTYFINQASSIKEVNNLLNRGKTEYKKASDKTVRKWEKAASEKIATLNK